MLISQLLSSVNMLFSKTGSFISPFTQKLLSATRLFTGVVLQFTGVVLQYDYLSRLRLALTRMQNFFYEKPVSLFDSIFVESSINVP